MDLLLSIPLRRYDSLMERVEPTSRAHEILINGFIERQAKDGHFVRTFELLCKQEEAEMLLDLAKRVCPDAVQDIARAINSACQ
jgi:hypothetical protein